MITAKTELRVSRFLLGNAAVAFVVLMALLAIFNTQPIDAATTGKIAGTVRDAQTGEPLPGANVILDGTTRGATTDANGYYVVLLVDPDIYTMATSMVGYDEQRQTDVRVQSDHTTLDFAIRETALALGELVVVAERPLVEPDKTTSKYILSAEDLEAIPIVRDLEDFVELQAGMSIDEDGNEIMIRGGDAKDVAYVVDGVRMVSTDHGGGVHGEAADGTRVYRDINKTSVQELTVITGGYGAEYGNAQGGVVSIVTRQGGQAYHGMADYQFIPAGKKHWGKTLYESPGYRGKMKWDDPEWLSRTVTLPQEATQLGDLAGQTVQAHNRLGLHRQGGTPPGRQPLRPPVQRFDLLRKQPVAKARLPLPCRQPDQPRELNFSVRVRW